MSSLRLESRQYKAKGIAMITLRIDDIPSSNNKYIGREAKYGVREAVDKGVRDYIYKEKANIIERVIDRAAKEIVRKGLPKLVERIESED